MEVVQKRSANCVPMVAATCFAFLIAIPMALWFPARGMLFIVSFVGLGIAQLVVRSKSNPLKKRKRLLVLSIIKVSLMLALLLTSIIFELILIKSSGHLYFMLFALSPTFSIFFVFLLQGICEISIIKEMPIFFSPTQGAGENPTVKDVSINEEKN